MMIKENSKVRFIDDVKHEKYGILLVFNLKNGFATIGKGDFESYGQHLMTVPINELMLAN
ncbi:MAG TPA: hypothetical protein PLI97_09280 [Fluviicola sp.]|jgi:hypothetical protein|nr:hypothetical protein [Fluviicola sp.]